jgi:hypothetical protein
MKTRSWRETRRVVVVEFMGEITSVVEVDLDRLIEGGIARVIEVDHPPMIETEGTERRSRFE